MKKKKKENEDKPIKYPIFRSPRTLGQKAADKLTSLAGSWTFILIFLMFIGLWMFFNINILIQYNLGKPWDPYPFILLNLVLSCLAAIQAPIILMSQNRTVQRDRFKMEYDYRINKKAEKEIREIKRLLMKRRRK